ncbi:hypothetical protein GE21DRAFT_1007337 [Neurospora crassa]|nr:hypothetical protein GE21DRAFT_1007337 [Neurospora crassa]
MVETMSVLYVTVASCSMLTQCFQLEQKPNVTDQSNAKSFLALNKNIGHCRKSFDTPSLQWVYPPVSVPLCSVTQKVRRPACIYDGTVYESV